MHTPKFHHTKYVTGVMALSLALMTPGLAGAHGFAGKRFFPATLTFDDPFAADEFDLLYNHTNDQAGEDQSQDLDSLALEYAKTITPTVALSVGAEYDRFKFADGTSADGFNNIEIGSKFLGEVNDQSESVWSYGLDVELGNTGRSTIAEDFTVFSPTLFLGKGFGNIPWDFFRPMAVTSAIAVDLPANGSQPRVLNTSFSLQYNFSYMSSFVKDIGLPGFIRNSLFIVELPVSTPLSHGSGGDVTGTINPGIVLFNDMGQVTVEAPIPINSRTGDGIGVLVQLHFYLDDIFPHSLGKPIFN